MNVLAVHRWCMVYKNKYLGDSYSFYLFAPAICNLGEKILRGGGERQNQISWGRSSRKMNVSSNLDFRTVLRVMMCYAAPVYPSTCPHAKESTASHSRVELVSQRGYTVTAKGKFLCVWQRSDVPPKCATANFYPLQISSRWQKGTQANTSPPALQADILTKVASVSRMLRCHRVIRSRWFCGQVRLNVTFTDNNDAPAGRTRRTSFTLEFALGAQLVSF